MSGCNRLALPWHLDRRERHTSCTRRDAALVQVGLAGFAAPSRRAQLRAARPVHRSWMAQSCAGGCPLTAVRQVAADRNDLPGTPESDARADEWVGPRPCTPDGLPLIGSTTSPRVYVAGGPGMWGITLGPISGQLLAEAISTGHKPTALAPFDPLR
jgi:hypothetical protein